MVSLIIYYTIGFKTTRSKRHEQQAKDDIDQFDNNLNVS